MGTLPVELENIMLIAIVFFILYVLLTIFARSLFLWLFAKLLNSNTPRYLTALLVALINFGIFIVSAFIIGFGTEALVMNNENLKAVFGYLMIIPGFIAEIIALKYMYKTSWGKAIANALLTGIVLFILFFFLIFILVMVVASLGFMPQY